jgi:hypothetical protein
MLYFLYEGLHLRVAGGFDSGCAVSGLAVLCAQDLLLNLDGLFHFDLMDEFELPLLFLERLLFDFNCLGFSMQQSILLCQILSGGHFGFGPFGREHT